MGVVNAGVPIVSVAFCFSSRMTIAPIVIGKYVYIQDDLKGGFQAVDVHHILVQKRSARDFLFYFAIVTLLAYTFSLVLYKGNPSAFFLSNILLGIFILKAWHGKLAKKESVVIMPGFGVQLETHYKSGKVIRSFVPIGNILRPVLNECVTPVTCYWSLALIMHGEAELMLVFRELQPPVKMLVPIWKALLVATGSKETQI
ncbi:hypothetical protein IFM89_003860 [Coptis chinensis]|uniref:Phosphatidylinositol N-acetylglucosaminyltransferase subunit H conserved domain-containing protein n=1 Tax=Coptis chinensis TaxID=261450 RepID=A0A835HVX3_9MAGN|nr:hypothetical protein IFM89_003860 [Coptis chinensis]